MPNAHLVLLALSFYTRIPVSNNLDYTKLPEASIFLPLIGWIVGGLSGLCFYFTAQWWDQTTAVILSLVCGILLTGAFHEDGFADVCDGFGGGYGKERILEIMKDSQIGTYGALGLILLIGLKASLLCSLPALMVPFTVLAGHSFSRFFPLLLMFCYDYARTVPSKSGASVYKPKANELVLAGIISLIPFILLPINTWLAIPLIMLVSWQLGRYFYRHIGGYTGDCLGASQQVAEVVFYLTAGALWTST
ncbi:adenosylcobinamide-GDP ribazoletransferase [biofilm metagenome]